MRDETSSHDSTGRTGEPRVDGALARLEELAEQPVTAHVAIFDDVHRRLHEALTAIDEG